MNFHVKCLDLFLWWLNYDCVLHTLFFLLHTLLVLEMLLYISAFGLGLSIISLLSLELLVCTKSLWKGADFNFCMFFFNKRWYVFCTPVSQSVYHIKQVVNDPYWFFYWGHMDPKIQQFNMWKILCFFTGHHVKSSFFFLTLQHGRAYVFLINS